MAPFPPYGPRPQYGPRLYPSPPSQPPPPLAKNDSRAVVALVLGLLSMTCMGLFAGIPAIVIGAMSRKEIDRSQGAR